MLERPLTIALSKGRILEQTLPLLRHAGLQADEDMLRTRKLMVSGRDRDGMPLRFLIIRAADVCTYVMQGAADLGVVGRDLLLEHRPEVYAPLDLEIGRCRLCVAGPEALVREGPPPPGSRVRVATKYDHIAARYYHEQGMQCEIIHLYGSMELAPLVGMAERIVDVVETGGTLKANGLVEEATLYEISSRLIVNPASAITRKAWITPLIEQLRAGVAAQRRSREEA